LGSRVVVSVSAFTVDTVVERVEAGEVRSAMEWAQVRALAADGVSQREIAARLGINRRTVRRLVEAADPPRYRRQSTRSMLDPLEPVVRRLLEEWPEINAPRVTEILRDSGYEGSGRSGQEALGADAAKQGPAGAEDESVALPLGLVPRPSATPATASMPRSPLCTARFPVSVVAELSTWMPSAAAPMATLSSSRACL
jgi:Homeodomain-like domain